MSRPQGWALIEEARAGRAAPWLSRFLSTLGRGAHRHAMFHPGDRVLIGVSGGKDSLALALGLTLWRRRLPFRLELSALTVDWESFPAPEPGIAALREFFDFLEMPYEVLRADPGIYAPAGPFSCYACARARKRLLFDRAQAEGAGVVAFGHHLDDAAETLLMNLAWKGRSEGLAPLRSFAGGRIRVVRPLIEVREGSIRTLANRLDLPVLSVDCPYKETNLREKLGPVIAQLAQMNKLVRENLYRASLAGTAHASMALADTALVGAARGEDGGDESGGGASSAAEGGVAGWKSGT